MKKGLVITLIILVLACVAGIIAWKIYRFRNGESFGILSNLEEKAPTSAPVTPTSEPDMSEQDDGSDTGNVTVTPLVVVKVRDVLITENDELMALFGDCSRDIIYGDVIPEKMQVIEDTVGILRDGDRVYAEFFATDSDGAWLRLLYGEDEKLYVERCEEERCAFVEDKTRTELCLTWVTLENTEEYSSERFSVTQEAFLSYIQRALFDGAYFEVYQQMDHERAAEVLGESASYSQFVWYADNLRTIIKVRISEQLVANFLGCDVRDGYCYAGVQFGNFDAETGEYRKVVEVWSALFYEGNAVNGFWIFGPGVLEQLPELMESE